MKLGTGFPEPTAEAVLFPRWTAIPLLNGTLTTPDASSEPSSTEAKDDEPDKTPSSIPQPVYTTVNVVPAAEVEATKTSHAPIPQYPTAPGSAAAPILKGYCTEPAYTILDGPTALWVPVVGCISSKADCCPTSTGGSGASPTGPAQGVNEKKADESAGGSNAAENGGAAATFPISSFPGQGTLTGCPKDYHTVGGTACCPSSYWPWSAAIGGQIPCYSSLAKALTPPGMPDSLVHGVDDNPITTGPSMPTPSSTVGVSSTSSPKPTSAVVNIAYAMQYSMKASPKPKMQQGTKIGIGAGVGGAALVISVLLFLLFKRFRGNKKSKIVVDQPPPGVQERFAHGVDKSYVAHQAPSRTYEGVQYAGVSNQAPGHHY
ncbi:hypothetical protein P154DRAFT_210264 [Amniculicola lignicola CBS 123094]|uniref:Mid2 domain-containing protein n=1 Tax=Amniculicola lignicola CBS 123094 TaxID=1392246 RepID=A0A6A5WEG4_9PLEO|nr:hypothetical protein P154DRAFT_210264 [Amniculicola lignicola CBS 123094]